MVLVQVGSLMEQQAITVGTAATDTDVAACAEKAHRHRRITLTASDVEAFADYLRSINGSPRRLYRHQIFQGIP